MPLGNAKRRRLFRGVEYLPSLSFIHMIHTYLSLSSPAVNKPNRYLVYALPDPDCAMDGFESFTFLTSSICRKFYDDYERPHSSTRFDLITNPTRYSASVPRAEPQGNSGQERTSPRVRRTRKGPCSTRYQHRFYSASALPLQ